MRGFATETRVLSPTAILGYGFPLESLYNGLSLEPDVIAVDAGSTDPGPYYLGSGEPLVPDEAVRRDLYYLVKASKEHEIPLVIGSAGGGGSRLHVERTLRLLGDIAGRLGGGMRVAVVYSDLPLDWLESEAPNRRQVDLGIGRPLSSVRDPGAAVAQNGVESIVEALKTGAQVILAGRVVDVAPFAALPWMKGHDRGLAVHMGKILECGAIAAEPGSGSDGIIGIIGNNGFEVLPLSRDRRATRVSVAEHALYERTDPFHEYVPGGRAYLGDAVYEETDRGVLVRGSKWIPSSSYMVKLEGARMVGYRYVVVAGARDEGFIENLESLTREALRRVEELVGGGFKAFFRFYGWNGVLGGSEPMGKGHEVGFVVEVIAESRGKAKTAAALLRSTLLHLGWPGRKTTAGNLAFPFSPSDLYAGEAYEWSLWHLVELRDPLELTRIVEVVF